MPLLFSYGTLQQEAVQREIFGRAFASRLDALVGFERSMITLDDEDFVRPDGSADYPIVRPGGDSESRISGTVLELTAAELAAADEYEPWPYERITATLESGSEAWVYADARARP